MKFVQSQHFPAHQLLLLLAGLGLTSQPGELGVALLVGGVQAVDPSQDPYRFFYLALFDENFSFSKQRLFIVGFNFKDLMKRMSNCFLDVFRRI